MKRTRAKIVNKLGLHARPAAEFVRMARGFKAEVWICKKDGRFSASSILEVLSANLDYGCIITLEADGPDEAEALTKLVALIRDFAGREDSH